MKIVVAPNALKGSLAASEAADAMAAGVRLAIPGAEVVCVPVADGGDGLEDVLSTMPGARRVECEVAGPLGEPVAASWLHLPDASTGVVEMAVASGLALVPSERRDAMRASTFGTGQLIADALGSGVRHLIVGVGGSATSDGGTGMAAALGVKFLDADGASVDPCGASLSTMQRIDASACHPSVAGALVETLCDVDNPLLGERGAARVYSPQKGATPEQVERLEEGLAHLADLIERDIGVEVRAMPGAGAAGGLAAGLHAFLGAKLRPGADVVLDLVDLGGKIEGADLVITAEGRLDEQTVFGKAPAAVAAAARRCGVPCFAIAGSLAGDRGPLREAGLDAVFSLCPGPVSLEDAMADARALVAAAAEEAVRAFASGARVVRSQ